MSRPFRSRFYLCTNAQWLLALLFLWLMRLPFTVYNADGLDVSSAGEYMQLALRGLRFDVSATAYFMAPFILLRILPMMGVRRGFWLRLSDWMWYLGISLLLIISAADIPYFRFTGARLRSAMLGTVMTDAHPADLAAAYLAQYWWLVLVVAALIALAVMLFRRLEPWPQDAAGSRRSPLWMRVAMFVVLGLLTFLAMRGRAGAGNPLSIPDAAFGLRSAPQINVVLNSPFTLIRSGNSKKSNSEPMLTFFTDGQLAAMRTSLHTPLTRQCSCAGM